MLSEPERAIKPFSLPPPLGTAMIQWVKSIAWFFALLKT